MIHFLTDTTTTDIARELNLAQEHYTLTTGRVLTLIIVASASDDVEAILRASRDASHEHPARVLILLTGDSMDETYLDAELRVGGEAGASEIVVMTLNGAMAHHPSSIVTPLLLPDTPIVAWWPNVHPESPAEDPIGKIAQRRITSAQDFSQLSRNYSPGDSDTAWSAITAWRGIVASALDRYPHHEVRSINISGSQGPEHAIAAGWLADALGVPVTRTTAMPDSSSAADANHQGEEQFAVESLTLVMDDGEAISITRADSHTVGVQVPGAARNLVALNVRSWAERLSEELRHLEPDETYARALRAIYFDNSHAEG